MPTERLILSVIDASARRTAQAARMELAPVVSGQTPHGRTGATAAALAPRYSRTRTGHAVTVASPRGRRHPSGNATIAQVVRWVNTGTGVRRKGPGPKTRIRSSRRPPRPLRIAGREVWTVAGQRPNPFMDRIQTIGTIRVQRAYNQGARDAALAVERVIG